MDDCAVCFEKITNQHFCVPCRHMFCYECISSWEERTCPLCREKIKSYKPVLSYNGDNSGLITLNETELKMILFVLLMVIFMLIDSLSSKGFMHTVIFPLLNTLLSILFEFFGLVFFILKMPIKSIYRLVVEVLLDELYNIFRATYQTLLAIGQILLNLLVIFYAELKGYFQEDSELSLSIFLRFILIGLMILLIISLSPADVLNVLTCLRNKVEMKYNNTIVMRFRCQKNLIDNSDTYNSADLRGNVKSSQIFKRKRIA